MNIELIESVRKKKGLTQVELAKMIGYSTAGYQKMISTNDVKVSVLEKIAKIFSLDIQVFFKKDNNKSVKKETYQNPEIETSSENLAIFQRADELQKELLACYKTISSMQYKILMVNQAKFKKEAKLELPKKRKYKKRK